MKPTVSIPVCLFLFAGCVVPPPCEGQFLEDGLCYSLLALSENSSGVLEVGDFNGDFLPDLLEGGENIFLSDGAGSFEPLGTLNFPGQSADLDSDSFSDLFFLSFSLVVVQLNQQNLTFDFPVSFDTGLETPDFVRSADLDSDGDLDLLVIASPSSYAVLKNDGQANFSEPTVFSLPLFGVTDLRVSDLNQDNFPDVAYLTLDSVCVLLNDGLANFSSTFCTTPGFLGIPGLLNLLDLNQDLAPDLIGIQLAQRELFVLENLTTGADLPLLSSPSFFPVEPKPQRSAVSDLNADGRDDFLVTHNSSTQISLWLHTNEPFLETLLTLEVNDFPRDLLANDFNGDSIADIAVSTENGLFLFLSTPTSP